MACPAAWVGSSQIVAVSAADHPQLETEQITREYSGLAHRHPPLKNETFKLAALAKATASRAKAESGGGENETYKSVADAVCRSAGSALVEVGVAYSLGRTQVGHIRNADAGLVKALGDCAFKARS